MIFFAAIASDPIDFLQYNNDVLPDTLKTCLQPLLFLFLFNSACSQPKSPVDVAADFWKSIQARDLNLLYKNVATDSVKKYKLEDMPAIGKVYLGEAVVDANKAWVETNVEIVDTTNLEIPVKTFLVRNKEKWKVNYDETVQSVSMNSEIARLFSNMEQIGDRFMEQFNDVIDEYQKTIPEIQRELKKLEENIKLQVPEIKDRLEEFAREIDKAIKKPPPPEKPDQPIEI